MQALAMLVKLILKLVVTLLVALWTVGKIAYDKLNSAASEKLDGATEHMENFSKLLEGMTEQIKTATEDTLIAVEQATSEPEPEPVQPTLAEA